MKKLSRRELLLSSLTVVAVAIIGVVYWWNPTSVVILVRHAEKAAGSNPPLTTAGSTRANELARVLEEQGLTAIYTSSAQRTQLTAAPTATAKGLSPTAEDDLDALESELKSSWGTLLVVGHSDTVPELVNRLAGTTFGILPESEFDHLFIVTRTRWGARRVVHLKYGVHS